MTTPVGFAPVFKGWNVWSIYQADVPDRSVLEEIWMAGVDPSRALRIWVEDQVDDHAPGAVVGDPVSPNPKKFKGEMVKEVPNANGLTQAAIRKEVPGLEGAQQLGEEGSGARLFFVRFYNRGEASALPWPHDKNFLVESVYQPDATNGLTNAPPPGSAAEDLQAAAGALGHGLEVVAWVAGGVAVLFILSKLGSRQS